MDHKADGTVASIAARSAGGGDDENEMRFLIETYGIDGIMTDDPPLLARVINELGVGD